MAKSTELEIFAQGCISSKHISLTLGIYCHGYGWASIAMAYGMAWCDFRHVLPWLWLGFCAGVAATKFSEPDRLSGGCQWKILYCFRLWWWWWWRNYNDGGDDDVEKGEGNVDDVDDCNRKKRKKTIWKRDGGTKLISWSFAWNDHQLGRELASSFLLLDWPSHGWNAKI